MNLSEEERRDRQRESMRKYYHKTAKYKPYESPLVSGWLFQFVGDNQAVLRRVWNIIDEPGSLP